MELLNNNNSTIKPIEFKVNNSIASNGKKVIVLFLNGINSNGKKVKIFSINYDVTNFDFICIKNFVSQVCIKFGNETKNLILKSNCIKFTDPEMKELKSL